MNSKYVIISLYRKLQPYTLNLSNTKCMNYKGTQLLIKPNIHP